MQSLSLADCQATTSDLEARLLAAYLSNTIKSYRDYKTLSEWLGCYNFDARQIRKLNETDLQIIKYLAETQTNPQTIADKILFLKDFNHGSKTKAIELLLNANTPLLPTQVST